MYDLQFALLIYFLFWIAEDIQTRVYTRKEVIAIQVALFAIPLLNFIPGVILLIDGIRFLTNPESYIKEQLSLIVYRESIRALNGTNHTIAELRESIRALNVTIAELWDNQSNSLTG